MKDDDPDGAVVFFKISLFRPKRYFDVGDGTEYSLCIPTYHLRISHMSLCCCFVDLIFRGRVFSPRIALLGLS